MIVTLPLLSAPLALAVSTVSLSKTVFFIRHGQSEGNAAGSDKDSADPRWLDCPLTSRGITQAKSWQPHMPAWGVDAVLVSPLFRALQTAAIIFQNAPPRLRLRITPSAREGWWQDSENRGRLAAGLHTGTKTGAADEPIGWRPLASLPGADRIEGIESVESPTPAAWDPEDEEAFLALNPAAAEVCWIASLGRLEEEIMACEGDTLAVVCHWGVMKALLEVEAPNCGVVRSTWRMDDQTNEIKREACEDVWVPPMDRRV